jgi:hypothetical protein
MIDEQAYATTIALVTEVKRMLAALISKLRANGSASSTRQRAALGAKD